MPKFIRFEHGRYYAEAFDTVLGPVQIDGLVRLHGTTLTLDEFGFRPIEQPVLPLGTGGLLAVRKQLSNVARAEGYTQLVLLGERITGKSPGRTVRYEWRLQ